MIGVQWAVKRCSPLVGVAAFLAIGSWNAVAQNSGSENGVVLIELPRGRGAGIVLSVSKTDNKNECLILTAYHVVQELVGKQEQVGVRFYRNPTRFKADIVDNWVDTSEDLAVIRVRGQSVPSTIRPLQLGSLDSINERSPIVAIGHRVDGGNEEWLSDDGKIAQPVGLLITFSRTTTDKGFSGGPLLNSKGEVIGMVTGVNTSGLGYAKNVNILRDFLRGKSIDFAEPLPALPVEVDSARPDTSKAPPKVPTGNPDQFVHIDADASGAYAWVLRVQAISPVQHYDIKIQAVLLGITAGTVRTVSKPLVLDLRPGNVPNNYVAYPDGMGREAAICYTGRASGQSAPMRLTEVFKVQFTSSGAVLVPNHEPTLGPASDAPCGDAHVIQTFQQQQEAAAKETAMAHPASPRAKPAPAANTAGTYYDPSTSLMWTLKDSGSGVIYAVARNYCTNLELAGFRDWRLPLEEELQALYDPNNPRKLTGPSQRLETVFVRGTIELSGSQVWSGTPSTKTLSGYKMVQAFDFTNNRAFGSIVVTTERVLCVRNNE